MQAGDYAIICQLPHSLLELTGNLHRAEFDEECGQVVEQHHTNLLRGFTLLGSGLLASDAPASVPHVSKVLCDLSLSDAASSSFPWSRLSGEHLLVCSSYLARTALGTNTNLCVPDLAYSEACVFVLDRVELAESSDVVDLSQVIYLSSVLRHLPRASCLAQKLQDTANSVFKRQKKNREARDIVAQVWNEHSALFNLTRERLLVVVESGSEAQSTCANCVVGGAVELAAQYAANTPVQTLAIALILCRSIHPAHRVAGLHVVRSLALTGFDVHFDACLEAIREALVLPFSLILVRSVSCITLLFSTNRYVPSSLTSPDPRCVRATQILLEALKRCVDEGGPAAVASCYVLRDVVQLAGISLLTNMKTFIRLLCTLFVHLANGLIHSDIVAFNDEFELNEMLDGKNSNLFDFICEAFENITKVAWSRLKAHRKLIIRTCMAVVLEASEQKRSEVHLASSRILKTLLTFDDTSTTEEILKALAVRASSLPSLINAHTLLNEILLAVPALSPTFQQSRQKYNTKFGSVVTRYFQSRSSVSQ